MAKLREIKFKFWKLIGNLDLLKVLLLDLFSLLDVIDNKVIGQNEARVAYMVRKVVEDIKLLRDNSVFILRERKDDE